MNRYEHKARRPLSIRIVFLLHVALISCYSWTLPVAAYNSSRRFIISTNKKRKGNSITYTTAGELLKPHQQPFSKHVRSTLASIFLPVGYPQSTPSGYLRYSVFSWVQDLSTQLRAVLATQRILEGVGVGRQGASAYSALLNFLVRDGCGMAASLLFTATAASRFQADTKRWRLFADIMVDIGITLEVAAVQMPTALFLPMICLGNMCKAMCGVAAGACGGAIHLHWAGTSQRLADVAAKSGAQHTVTGALGLIFAALFARTASQRPVWQLWCLYAVLTVVHLLANTMCMRLIAFDYLNTARMDHAVYEFFNQYSNSTSSNNCWISSPVSMARKEPLLFSLLPRKLPIHLGVPYTPVPQLDPNSMQQLLESSTSSYWILPKKRSIRVWMRQGITPLQQAKAYLHASWLRYHLLHREQSENSTSTVNEGIEQLALPTSSTTEILLNNSSSVHIADEDEVEEMWKLFCQHCDRAGWDLNRTDLELEGYEIHVER